MNYKIGDVVLFNWTEGIFMKLIGLYNKLTYGESKCTHAGIIVEIIDGTLFIYEAIENSGPAIYPYNKDWLDNKVKEGIVIIKRPKVKLKDIYRNSLKYYNIGYGWLDIISVGIYLLSGKKLALTKAKKVICSELVVRILYDSSDKKIDFEKEYDKPYDLITPMDIYKSTQLEGRTKRKTRHRYPLKGEHCELNGKLANAEERHHTTDPINVDDFIFLCKSYHKERHKWNTN